MLAVIHVTQSIIVQDFLAAGRTPQLAVIIPRPSDEVVTGSLSLSCRTQPHATCGFGKASVGGLGDFEVVWWKAILQVFLHARGWM
jgi:hypothetical protein